MAGNKSLALLILIFINLLLCGCTKELIVTKYYVLAPEVAELDKMQDTLLSIHTLPFAVVINNFYISKAYDQNRIVVRTQSNEIYYYFYHSWAENPESAVRYFIWNQIRQASLFQKCEMEYLDAKPEFQITGIIDQIERLDIKNNYSAHLKMTLLFKDMDSGQELIKHEFDRYLALRESSSMNTFAQKISQILQEESNQFVVKIYSNITAVQDKYILK